MNKNNSVSYTQLISGEQMNPLQMIKARLAMGYGQSDLARALKVPLRTLQDWEAGKRKIPCIAQVALSLFSERDRWVMKEVALSVSRRIAADHPHGIVSE